VAVAPSGGAGGDEDIPDDNDAALEHPYRGYKEGSVVARVRMDVVLLKVIRY
jgi:hypothetical protein